MIQVVQDLRHALRMLVRRPGFALAAVFTAALGVGAMTAMFGVADGVLLRPLPYADPDGLVYLGVAGSDPRPFFATSTPDFLDWRERLTTVEQVGAMELSSLVLARDGVSRRLTTARMSPDVLPMFRLAPALGRAFSPEEYASGAGSVAILSHGLWQRWGADPNIVGARIRTVGDGADLVVVGVLPAGFEVPAAARMESPELWLPLAVDAQAYASSRTSRTLRVIGRLAPGATVEEARREAESVALVLARDYPKAYMVSEAGQLTIAVASLRDQTVGSTGDAVLVLLGATGFLLLIACANVANLLLARATDREQEMALRLALGAPRRRLVSQLLTESGLLGLLGGVLGVVLSYALVRLLQVLGPADFPRLAEVTIDVRALGFALVVSLMTGVLFGLVPALMTSAAGPALALRQGGRGCSAGSGTSRLRRGLIVGEVALTLVLLSGAFLLATSYLRLRQVDVGFVSEGLQVVSIGLADTLGTDEMRVGYLRELERELEAVPGVESASFISALPVAGYTTWSPGLLVEGAEQTPVDGVDGLASGPGIFETMGIPLLAGHLFGVTATDPATLAAVVGVLSLVGILAGAVPAWRALRTNPIVALRAE